MLGMILNTIYTSMV